MARPAAILQAWNYPLSRLIPAASVRGYQVGQPYTAYSSPDRTPNQEALGAYISPGLVATSSSGSPSQASSSQEGRKLGPNHLLILGEPRLGGESSLESFKELLATWSHPPSAPDALRVIGSEADGSAGALRGRLPLGQRAPEVVQPHRIATTGTRPVRQSGATGVVGLRVLVPEMDWLSTNQSPPVRGGIHGYP